MRLRQLNAFLNTFLFGAALVGTTSVQAVELFRDQMTSAENWGVNKSSGFGEDDSTVTFAYDYSGDGIPEAPGTLLSDGATSGLKITANNGDTIDVQAYLTLFPIGQSFTGDYELRFDAWMNYDAVEANEGGANGTTEFLGGGIGYGGSAANVAVAGSGLQAIATGDGGSGSDWRVFKESYYLAAAEMAAGSRNNTALDHADFLPPVEVPAAQNQVGVADPQLSIAGAPGFQWITWSISTIDRLVSFYIEKPTGEELLIAEFDSTDNGVNGTDVSTDGNISLVYADFFASITARPNLTFGIIDNVVVHSIDARADDANFNEAGGVEGDDFLLWQAGFGMSDGAASLAEGDADANGNVNGADFAVWESQFGGGAAVATASVVPEPAASTLALGIVMICSVTRMRSSVTHRPRRKDRPEYNETNRPFV